MTDPQSVTVSFSGSPLLPWTASSNQSNVQVSPPSGTGLGTFQVTAAARPPARSSRSVRSWRTQFSANDTGQHRRRDAGQSLRKLRTRALNGATGVSGSIAVTGWALDSIEVTGVDIWREPVAGEPVSPPLIFIGNATFVAGARPDVQTANPTYPFNYQAGWGYLLLSNELPNNGGAGGPGNGTYRLHAIAHNKTGGSLDLGTKAITVNNAAATPPFGAIDTPGQGATASGTVTNFGWALTPPALGCPAASQPCIIPVNGSTIFVYVDGISLGNPVYNLARCDVDQLFPGYANSGSTNCALNGTSPGPVGTHAGHHAAYQWSSHHRLVGDGQCRQSTGHREPVFLRGELSRFQNGGGLLTPHISPYPTQVLVTRVSEHELAPQPLRCPDAVNRSYAEYRIMPSVRLWWRRLGQLTGSWRLAHST